jgi:hypothetical protein
MFINSLDGSGYAIETTVSRRAAVGGASAGSAPAYPKHRKPSHITGVAVDDPGQKISLAVPSFGLGIALLGTAVTVNGTPFHITGFHGEDITVPPAG